MPKLTVGACVKYTPKPWRREIWDTTPGLVLIIQPSGHKSWALRFRRPSGKGAKLTLGDFVEKAYSDGEPTIGAPLTLIQAREMANKLAHQRARGIDIIEEHKARKSRNRAAALDKATNTFGAAVREFFIDHKTKHKERARRWNEDARMLGLKWPTNCDPAKVEPTIIKGGLADVWATKPLADIDRHDIKAVIQGAIKQGIPGLEPRNGGASSNRGRKLHVALSTLFGWLLEEERVAANPCVGVNRPKPPKARDRVLSDEEIKSFWRGTDKLAEPFGAALRVLLLTGCRANEVIAMRWGELSADGDWLIPGSRTKNHREHLVPLPPLAREIIASVKRIEGDFVFTTTGRSAISGWSKIKARLDELMGVRDWVVHDLRRTVSTNMHKLGIPPHIVEAVLNHISGTRAGVAGTYNRYEYLPEKKAALLRWATHIQGLVSGDDNKVVALPKAKKAKRS